MPIPFIIGAAALAVGGAGVAAGVSGTKKMSEANSRIEDASKAYKKGESKMNKKQAKNEEVLGELGALKLSAFEELKRFLNTFEKIKNRPKMREVQQEGIDVPTHSLEKIERVQIQAVEVLGAAFAGAGAGALAGFATYGGIMTLGTASTGAAISGLSGVAATNATLAALGGGSLAAGGGGMALGAQVLGGAVAAPVVAVGGLLMNAKGNDSLEKAREVEREVDEALDQIGEIVSFLKRLTTYGSNVKVQIEKLLTVYDRYVSNLEYIVEGERDYNKYNMREKEIVNINIKVVSVLYNLLVQDLLEPKEEGSEELPVIKEAEIDEALEVSEEVLVAVS